MFLNMTTGVDFANILCEQIPQTQNGNQDISVFFALLGSARAKVAPKLLMKLTTGGDGLVLQRIFSAQNENHLQMHL